MVTQTDMYTTAPPADWKDFDTFVADMNTYRLPATEELAGKEMNFTFDDCQMSLKFDKQVVSWILNNKNGQDEYEAINVAPNVYIVTWKVSSQPTDVQTVVFNVETYRAVHVYQYVKSDAKPGEPRIGQDFYAGTLAGGTPTGKAPYKTKELTGLRAIYTYADDHDYEHYYITSRYFCWKGLSGAQKHDAAIEPAEYWKFDDNQYVFGWTEMIIPCSPIWFICFDGSFGDNRETGTFMHANEDGTARIEKAGAIIQKLGQAFYPNKFEKL